MGLSPFAVGTQTCKKTDSNNICTLWKSEIHYDTCKKYVVHPQWSAVAYGTDYKSEISCAEVSRILVFSYSRILLFFV